MWPSYLVISVKIVPDMTYNVFCGTLNPTLLYSVISVHNTKNQQFDLSTIINSAYVWTVALNISLSGIDFFLVALLCRANWKKTVQQLCAFIAVVVLNLKSVSIGNSTCLLCGVGHLHSVLILHRVLILVICVTYIIIVYCRLTDDLI